jgi:hypothetical protein
VDFKRFIDAFRKSTEKGPSWLFLRAKQELKNPTAFLFMKPVMNMIYHTKQRFKNLFRENVECNEDYITAVCDLNVFPVTFDFSFFLVGAELFARENGKSTFNILFVQRSLDIVNESYAAIFDEHSLQWKLENLVLPLISLSPACVGHSVLPKMSNISEILKNKLVYPPFYDGKNYTPAMDYKKVILSGKKNNFIGLSASAQGIRHIQKWKKLKKITGNMVTITLRQYDYDIARNSNVDEWIKFAEYIKAEGFTPVFVPDTWSCFKHESRLDGFILLRDVCWNMGLRIALYEEALLNFFVAGGPSTLAILNKKAKSVAMNLGVGESVHPQSTSFTDRGIAIGQRTYGFGGEYQVLAWKEDVHENICEEFNNFLAHSPESSPLPE